MATSTKNTPSKFQTEMQTLADAMAGSTLSLLSSMIVLGSSLSKAEVVIKLRAYIALYTAVSQAKQAYAAAVTARKNAQVAARAFYEAVLANVKQAVGPSNPSLLATFGISAPKERKAPSVEAKTIAKAKAAATRVARGTMSKKQRESIVTGNQPEVQVTNLAPSSLPASSVSPTSAPAASSVPAASSTSASPTHAAPSPS